jgi:hypothetical protein
MRLSTALLFAASTVAALVFCPAVRAADPPAPPAPTVNLWNYIHPDTQVLIGVDWQKAKNSPTGRMFARQLASSTAQFKSSGPGLDIFARLDRILLSTNGRQSSGPGDQPPVLIAIEGRLAKADLRKLMPAGTALERFKGVDLLVPPKGKETDMLMAVVNDRLALIGDRESIGRVLDSPAGSAAGPKDVSLLERATQLSSQCEIWMISTVPPSKASGGALPAMKQLDDIESLDFGLSLQKGLGLRANLVAKDDDAAKGLATLTQMMASMASQDPKQSPEFVSIARSLKVKSEGKAVNVSMEVPLAQLERGVAQMRASASTTGRKTLESFLGISPSGGLPPGLRPAVTGATVTASAAAMVPPAPPPTPRKRTIRISGLDEGSREITYVK